MDAAKRDLVRSWLLKASHDLTAARLLASAEPVLSDAAIYHCQQAAEKALKGYLAFNERPLERTHDIGRLVERAAEIESVFESWQDAADRLTPFATAYRYPGVNDSPDPEELVEAIDDAETIFRQVLSFLPEDVYPHS